MTEEIIKMKMCSTCGEWKPRSTLFFCNSSKSRDGFRFQCKECQKADRILHKDDIRARSVKYRETHRDVIAKKDSVRKKIAHLKNPEKDSIRGKKYYSENKEKVSKRRAAYVRTPLGKASIARKNHNRNIRIAATKSTLTLKQWNKILKMQNNKCADCWVEFSELTPPTRDHIIPVSFGGSLTFGNTRAVCGSCNSKKCNRVYIGNAIENILTGDI